MIDLLTIAMTHVLMLIAAWRLLSRDDLDHEGETDTETPPKPWLKRRGDGLGESGKEGAKNA